ncbi:cytochrome bd-I ubiquinol oxidase subunit 1 apoprotein [Asanoa ferruginea]|uniref:Cytochrome bd-I ubiquinol oxidase subunit 1 apoprotein n=1 Tax=Asanoa ferruginea TaxID=53367 RepID=A0A3D9ZGN6_9ACTN|nr:cytochrome ubiquinol oxidase subunit I [Asanoa ferruginea]REF95602.1 cytochrome bd-I ubiquinol oxidase subunit 1 apoprotein [Asanoa ferruginea]GIF51964.1 cytochrome ubiquinol oxidase subunit I [Asanoa ferruginea]
MDALDVARWQFGVTTIYHFLFVPLTIGLGPLVATFQTLWHRTGNPRYLRLTHFYGKLFLINFAMGVVTGIVQEFQFGMNWSDYSRYVGDVFGAPLAMEALLAFFLESTFLGLWIFGWKKLPKRIHLATIWTAALGSVLSMFFILAANSWMQHPVGYRMNPDTGRPELTDIWAVLTNKVALITFPHTLAAAFMVAGALLVAVSIWHVTCRPGTDTAEHRFALRFGAWVTLVATAAIVFTGDIQGKIMTEVQPMKMAAAEALYRTEAPASFSAFTIGTLDGSREVFAIKLPYLLSFLATGNPTASVQGIDDLQAQYTAQYGPGNYAPIVPVTYWSFRVMVGLGIAAGAIALLVLWSQRRGRTPNNRWLVRASLVLPLLPLGASTAGWLFTEMGRQPWIVFGELLTRNGVSRSVSLTEVLTSFLAFTLIYAVLAVVEGRLLFRYAKAGLPPDGPEPDESGGDEDVPALAGAY